MTQLNTNSSALICIQLNTWFMGRGNVCNSLSLFTTTQQPCCHLPSRRVCHYLYPVTPLQTSTSTSDKNQIFEFEPQQIDKAPAAPAMLQLTHAQRERVSLYECSAKPVIHTQDKQVWPSAKLSDINFEYAKWIITCRRKKPQHNQKHTEGIRRNIGGS